MDKELEKIYEEQIQKYSDKWFLELQKNSIYKAGIRVIEQYIEDDLCTDNTEKIANIKYIINSVKEKLKEKEKEND